MKGGKADDFYQVSPCEPYLVKASPPRSEVSILVPTLCPDTLAQSSNMRPVRKHAASHLEAPRILQQQCF